MVLLSLLPVGLMQTWASVEHGTWYARSAEFMQTPTMDTLRWLRVVGDTIFAAGLVALGWFVLGLKTGWSIAPGPDAVALEYPRVPVGTASRDGQVAEVNGSVADPVPRSAPRADRCDPVRPRNPRYFGTRRAQPKMWSGTRSRAEGDSRSAANQVRQHESRSSRHRARGNPVGRVGSSDRRLRKTCFTSLAAGVDLGIIVDRQAEDRRGVRILRVCRRPQSQSRTAARSHLLRLGQLALQGAQLV